MKWIYYPVLVVIFLLQPSDFIEEPLKARTLFAELRTVFFNIIGRSSSGRGYGRAANLNKVQIPVAPETPFPCDTSFGRSQTRPNWVHELRPGDIDVVGALGDSLTAGNGATASRLIEVTVENRGVSWSIGGQGTWRQFLTLPNILKEFNPNLIGYSLADSLSHHVEAQFNVAEIGSMSVDMSYMARVLVKRIKADKRVDFEKDWKLITLMVGPNDFCFEFCSLSPTDLKNVAQTHKQQLISVLDYLRDSLPRTLVNLVLAPNLEILHDLKGLPVKCSQMHLFSCPCLFGVLREKSYPYYIEKQREWQRVEREVAIDERYRKKKDFAVVLQPFIAHLIFPERTTEKGKVADSTYLSEDCFHFSQKGHARAANALWNNMLEPVGNKSENWADIFSKFLCPTQDRPYIFTHLNSPTSR